jgi:tetratricopeptide (TPR) repeat protein
MNPRIQQLIKFLESEPKDTFVLYALAMEYKNLGDKEKALIYYKRCLEVDENYVGVYYHLAALYSALGEEALAKATYQKGISVARAKNNQHPGIRLRR